MQDKVDKKKAALLDSFFFNLHHKDGQIRAFFP